MRGAAILCAVLAVLACQSPEEQKAEHSEQAESYFANEQWGEAKIEFLNLIRIDPDDADAHYKLAESLWRLREYRQALFEYAEAVRLGPENPKFRRGISGAEFIAGRYDRAIEHAEVMAELDPNADEAFVVLARSHAAQGDIEATLASAEDAIRVNPANEVALAIKAQALSVQGDHEAAEQVLKTLLKVSPSMKSEVLMGAYLVQNGRMDEARTSFEGALERAEGDEERLTAHVALANYHLVLQQDPAAAEKQILAAYEEFPDNADLLLQLGRFYVGQGNTVRAEEVLEAHAAAKPDEVEPLLLLAQFYRRLGKLDKSFSSLDRALALDPKSESGRLLRADYLMDQTEEDPEAEAKARALLAAVLDENPGSVAGLFSEAKFLLRDQKFEDASTRLRAVLQEQPSAVAHFLLASAYLSMDQEELARGELLSALQLDGSDERARSQLAALYLRSGNRELAAQEAQIVIAGKPEAARTRLILVEALVGLDRKDEAFEVLDAFPFEDPTTDWMLRLRAAHMYRVGGKLGRARELIEAMMKERPEAPEVLRQLIAIEAVEGDPLAALPLLEKAIETSPDDAELYEIRGGLRLGFKRGGAPVFPDEAEADLLKAIALGPDRSQPYSLLAGLYYDLGRSEDAVTRYQEAADRAPETIADRFKLGMLYEGLGRAKEARATYEKVLRIDEDHSETKNNLAFLIADAPNPTDQELDRALELAQDAKANSPQNPGIADTLGWVMYKKDIQPAAISLLKEAIEGFPPRHPDLATVRGHLASALERNGQPDLALEQLRVAAPLFEAHKRKEEAAEIYSRVLELDPNDPVAMNNLAWLLSNQTGAGGTDLDRALELAREAKQRLPGNPVVSDTLGWVMYKREVHAEAIVLFEEAIGGFKRGAPARAVALYHLALTFEGAGQLGRAAETLEAALKETEQFPERPLVEEALKRIRASS